MIKYLKTGLLSGILLFASFGSYAMKWEEVQADDTTKYVSPYQEENERCLKCHGQERYEYDNESLGTTVKDLMCTDRIIPRDDFYRANHRKFACTDCHSADYNTFPHPGELRMELKYNCLDCHGGDEAFAKFNFEGIDAAYKQSVHYKLEEYGYTCWSCHNPHSYRINIRNSQNLKETILYDNNICLHCHSDQNRLNLMSDEMNADIMKTHEWLPNQASHFKNVRCIECHAKANDTLLVSHQILKKDEAVKRCNECHSRNSLLMASLYKFKSKEQRRDGFFNGIILNESYVIGANRNEYLNIFSIVVFGFVLLVIGVHIYFRVTKK